MHLHLNYFPTACFFPVIEEFANVYYLFSQKKSCPCYPFLVTFNIRECPRDKVVPVMLYIIAAINSFSLTSLSFCPS